MPMVDDVLFELFSVEEDAVKALRRVPLRELMEMRGLAAELVDTISDQLDNKPIGQEEWESQHEADE